MSRTLAARVAALERHRNRRGMVIEPFTGPGGTPWERIIGPTGYAIEAPVMVDADDWLTTDSTM